MRVPLFAARLLMAGCMARDQSGLAPIPLTGGSGGSGKDSYQASTARSSNDDAGNALSFADMVAGLGAGGQ
ncbi:hypothetical protein KTAU_39230 [Thermogemmatispora aurantia]|uniref:Uncharacterized protein n=1 Tax=Thermogemmatispora aurantia TaxID=2045279 RepID=A0A5J4K9Q4_9CHLR|nr:hypothetical protein KTAU_39230 [Thermogemmatispora aurantia]